MKILKLLLCLFCFFHFQVHSTSVQSLVTEAEALKNIKQFSQSVADKHQFNQQAIFELLSSLKEDETIIAKMTKPAESVMPWFTYRNIWMKDQRIDDGVIFWQKHQDTLNKAEQIYGVPPAIIVGILGVETFYGKIQGNHSVLSSLHTLAFYYPPRAEFFKRELVEYLLLARQESWPLDKIKGSYAGAMGMGQFISSSYRTYAVDFNQDGKIDLFNDPVDMIGSIANYFKRHHWLRDGFVAKPIVLTKEQIPLVQTDLKPTLSLNQLEQKNINIDGLQNHTESAAIYAFEKAENQYEYWLGGDNFYVITRYNHNAMYALAVYQVSQAIQAKMQLVN